MVLIYKVFLITTKSLSFSFTNQALVEPIYLFTYFGNPPSPIRFKINTFLHFTHIGPMLYDSEHSTSGKYISHDPVSIEDKIYIPELYKDYVIIGEDNIANITNYMFYVFSPNTHDWNNGFAFAYKMNESFSMVHQLYNSNQINKRSFAFLPYENEENMKKGTLYFGDVPQDKLNKYKQRGYCKVNENNVPWGCQLSSITLKGVKFDVNEYTIFNTCQFNTILSNKLFELLYENVFKDWIDKKTCYRIDVKTRSSMKCLEEIINQLGNITLTFESGLSISFDLASLFVCDEFLCESLYLSDNTNKENFEFGGAFIKMFNASVFNYEDKSISLYSNTIRIEMKTTNTIEGLFNICGMLNIIGIVLLALRKIF